MTAGDSSGAVCPGGLGGRWRPRLKHRPTGVSFICRYPVHMTRADKLFKRLKAARLDNTLDAEMRRLAHVQVLIIDDLCLQALDATETADFYELVVEKHHKTSIAITSNREPNEWLSMMADPLLAQSAVDRLTSTAHELIIEGESYRQRQRPGRHTES